MTLLLVLDKIRQAGGSVRVEDQELRISAPAGLLDTQDRDCLAEHKSELVRVLAPVDEYAKQEREAIVWSESASPSELDEALERWDQTCQECGSSKLLAGKRFVWCLECESREGTNDNNRS